MSYLVDTNVLLRSIQLASPVHELAVNAVIALLLRDEDLYITPQNLIEFWNVATRPLDKNGLGMTPARADREVQQLERDLLLAPDVPAIYPAWRRLVVTAAVSGVQVHDARLAAVMMAHGISHILTFNGDDFRRFEYSAGITVVHPREVTEDTPVGDG